jgi:hypothetical protein
MLFLPGSQRHQELGVLGVVYLGLSVSDGRAHLGTCFPD